MCTRVQRAKNGLTAGAAECSKGPGAKGILVAKFRIDQIGEATAIGIPRIQFCVKLEDTLAGFNMDRIEPFVFGSGIGVKRFYLSVRQELDELCVHTARYHVIDRLSHRRMNVVGVVRFDERVIGYRCCRPCPTTARRMQSLLGFPGGANLDQIFQVPGKDRSRRGRNDRDGWVVVFACPGFSEDFIERHRNLSLKRNRMKNELNNTRTGCGTLLIQFSRYFSATNAARWTPAAAFVPARLKRCNVNSPFAN